MRKRGLAFGSTSSGSSCGPRRSGPESLPCPGDLLSSRWLPSLELCFLGLACRSTSHPLLAKLARDGLPSWMSGVIGPCRARAGSSRSSATAHVERCIRVHGTSQHYVHLLRDGCRSAAYHHLALGGKREPAQNASGHEAHQWRRLAIEDSGFITGYDFNQTGQARWSAPMCTAPIFRSRTAGHPCAKPLERDGDQ